MRSSSGRPIRYNEKKQNKERGSRPKLSVIYLLYGVRDDIEVLNLILTTNYHCTEIDEKWKKYVINIWFPFTPYIFCNINVFMTIKCSYTHLTQLIYTHILKVNSLEFIHGFFQLNHCQNVIITSSQKV